MRVLHILNDVSDCGNGIVNTAVDLAMEQARQGLDVAVISAGGGYQTLLEKAGVIHLTLDQSRRPAQLLRALRTLNAQLGNYRPDIVHAHMRTGLLLAWLLRPLHRHALISHLHNVHDRESIMMGLADRVIAVSQSVAETTAAQGIPKRKIRVVLNRTLQSGRVPALATIQPAVLEHPSIVTVCGMNHRKGIEELINAFELVGSECQDAHLYLVGDGPDRAQFESQARRCSWSSRIHFEGYQPLPQSYMLSADVFVLASRRESFGLVLIEAREAGCAVIAANVDGVAEALDGGNAGILIPPKDPTALAGALRQLLSNPAEREKWRALAPKGIAKFRVDRMASEITTVYAELAKGNASSIASDSNARRSLSLSVSMQSQRPMDDRESEAAHS
jgi:glycosyltransferase involved in cell wall biosynthesis